MKYRGTDFVNKTPFENVNNLFDSICIELVKRNEILFNKIKELTIEHLEILLNEVKETDKQRPPLFELEPTLKAMKKELDNIKMFT